MTCGHAWTEVTWDTVKKGWQPVYIYKERMRKIVTCLKFEMGTLSNCHIIKGNICTNTFMMLLRMSFPSLSSCTWRSLSKKKKLKSWNIMKHLSWRHYWALSRGLSFWKSAASCSNWTVETVGSRIEFWLRWTGWEGESHWCQMENERVNNSLVATNLHSDSEIWKSVI